MPGTYGSILDTLRHLVDGDVFYLDVLRGGEPESFDKEASIPTLRAVMEAHDPVWQALVARDLDAATDVVEYEDGGYETHAPLGIRLAQALYHGTDHRSQVCTALTSSRHRAAGDRGLGHRPRGRPDVHDRIDRSARALDLRLSA